MKWLSYHFDCELRSALTLQHTRNLEDNFTIQTFSGGLDVWRHKNNVQIERIIATGFQWIWIYRILSAMRPLNVSHVVNTTVFSFNSCNRKYFQVYKIKKGQRYFLICVRLLIWIACKSSKCAHWLYLFENALELYMS